MWHVYLIQQCPRFKVSYNVITRICDLGEKAGTIFTRLGATFKKDMGVFDINHAIG